MNATTNDDLHGAHAAVLLGQLVRDTIEVFEQYGLFKPEQNRDMAKDLLFRICAVLDGSSFPGVLNDEEIAPFVGFYLAHDTQSPLIPENGSGMHSFVDQAVNDFYEMRAAG